MLAKAVFPLGAAFLGAAHQLPPRQQCEGYGRGWVGLAVSFSGEARGFAVHYEVGCHCKERQEMRSGIPAG